MKKIYHDTLMYFGKYKNMAVMDIVKKDPGYLIWCQAAGIVEMDDKTQNELSKWVKASHANALYAAKQVNAGLSYRKDKGAIPTVDGKSSMIDENDTLPDVSAVKQSFQAAQAEKSAGWGDW